jgi:peroxin-14
LDTALTELETVIGDLKAANRRREYEAQRVRDDVQGLKDSLPRALETQKEATDNRLREVNTELKSLKTLITQRMNPTSTSTSVSNYLRPSSGNAAPSGGAATPPVASAASDVENADAGGKTEEQPKTAEGPATAGRNSPFSSGMTRASIPSWQRAAAANSTSGSGTEASGVA